MKEEVIYTNKDFDVIDMRTISIYCKHCNVAPIEYHFAKGETGVNIRAFLKEARKNFKHSPSCVINPEHRNN